MALHHGGTFVTIDEPTLTHHYHPCRRLSTVPSRCCASCEFGPVVTTSAHCLPALSILAPPCSSLPSLLPWETTDLCVICIVLTFPECHTVGVIRHVTFEIGSFHVIIRIYVSSVFAWLIAHFLVLNNTPLTYVVQFIHSSPEGYLGCFQILPFIKKL